MDEVRQVLSSSVQRLLRPLVRILLRSCTFMPIYIMIFAWCFCKFFIPAGYLSY
jgi:hypothetical protein